MFSNRTNKDIMQSDHAAWQSFCYPDSTKQKIYDILYRTSTTTKTFYSRWNSVCGLRPILVFIYNNTTYLILYLTKILHSFMDYLLFSQLKKMKRHNNFHSWKKKHNNRMNKKGKNVIHKFVT